MLEGKLSRRYGNAIFELAAGREASVAGELDNFLDAYKNSDLNKVLGNPTFAVADRKQLALQVAQQLQVSESTQNLLAILVEKHRVGYLPAIVAYYHRRLDELEGRVNATVVAPEPLDTTKREELVTLVSELSGKQAVLRERIDPSIIGGVIIEVGGTVYDGSVRTQLQGIKESIARTL